MGTLSERIAFLTTRYGSDRAAWQPELHALASLEESDPKAALARFHELKRRLAEFRRAELLRALRAFPFAQRVPSGDAKGYPLKEIEADIRVASRALAHARAVAAAREESAQLANALRRRAAPAMGALRAAAWDALGPLAEAAEAERRVIAREARLDARIVDVERRARKLARVKPPVADASALPADEADVALDAVDATLAEAERLEKAHDDATSPLRAPEVATYFHESKRRLEREATALLDQRDLAGLAALAARAQQLRVDAARKASEAARARRRGLSGPERERRPGDAMDGYL